MSQQTLQRSHILTRICDRQLQKYNPFNGDVYPGQIPIIVSDKFLACVLEVLSTAGNNHTSIYNALKNTVTPFASDIDQIRWELARVPVLFVYKQQVRHSWVGNRQESWRFERDDLCFAYGSNNFPRDVLLDDISILQDGSIMCCFYPPELAQKVFSLVIPTWQEDNSFVDRIFEKTLQISCSKIDGDTIWTFHNTNVQQENLTAKDRLHDFICQNSPVNTCTILDQQFAKRSQTFNLLQELVKEKKIENKTPGLYNAIK